MTILRSTLDTRSEEFRRNGDALQAQVADLRAKVEEIRLGGGKTARERHLSRGKLLPRERVRTLLDPGAPFLELSQLAAHGVYEEPVPAAVWEEAKRHYDEKGLAALSLAIATINVWNRLNAITRQVAGEWLASQQPLHA